MKPSSSRTYSTRSSNCAKLFTVWACTALLCSPLCSASGSDDTASIDHIKGTLDILNEYIQTDQYQMFLDWKADELRALGQVVPAEYQDRVLKTLAGVGVDDTFQWSETDNVRAYLQALTRAFYGSSAHTSNPLPGSLLDYQRKQFSRLGDVLSRLDALTNASSSASTATDVLAGNPWWATNSLFAFDNQFMSQAYPKLSPGLHPVSTFPQFMSYWSSQLTIPTYNLESSVPYIWQQLFGNSRRAFTGGSGTTYTWFDWMAEAMKSNWVAQATEQSTLDAMAASLNGGSTNLVNVYVTNIVGGVTNILNADDILAGNPWWATNSGFRISYHNSLVEPYPRALDGALSFPELMSALSGSHVRFQTPPLQDSFDDLFNGYLSWGYDRWNTTRGQVYTFEDWLADAMRSNLVLVAALAGTTNAPADVATNVLAAVDDGSMDGTNRIPDMVVDQMDVTGVEAGIDLVDADAVGAMLPASYTGGNPEFVVFSGGRYGDVTVPEVRGSLALPENVARYLRGVASWLWRVALFVGCFIILRQEVAFWSTLGGSTSDA